MMYSCTSPLAPLIETERKAKYAKNPATERMQPILAVQTTAFIHDDPAAPSIRDRSTIRKGTGSA